jgi:hypothetical protein
VIRLRDISDAPTQFVATRSRILRAVVLLIVFFCLLDHVTEALIGWDQQIWQTGRDTETTLFLVFLFVGLAFALATLIRLSAKLLRTIESILASFQIENLTPSFGIAIRPDSSPPLPLRI